MFITFMSVMVEVADLTFVPINGQMALTYQVHKLVRASHVVT